MQRELGIPEECNVEKKKKKKERKKRKLDSKLQQNCKNAEYDVGL